MVASDFLGHIDVERFDAPADAVIQLGLSGSKRDTNFIRLSWIASLSLQR